MNALFVFNEVQIIIHKLFFPLDKWGKHTSSLGLDVCVLRPTSQLFCIYMLGTLFNLILSMPWCKAIALFSAFICFTIWCSPSNWFIIVCPWRRAVYLPETSIVFGAQWFSSLVLVHLFLLFLLTVILSVILLTYSFPHIKLVYLVFFSLFI